MLTRFARTTALVLALTGLGAGLAVADDGFVPPFVGQWDLDGDGTVTPDEMVTRRGDLFVMFDEDENGILEGDELTMMSETSAAQQEVMSDERAQMQAMQGMNGMQGMRGKGGKGGMHGAADPHGGQAHDDVAMADVNKDGKLTRDEFMALSGVAMSMLDRNRDGVINAADFGVNR